MVSGGRSVLAVLGPTASGKSALGLALAQRHRGEVISCDSTAVYRGFDIGTDKPSLDARRGVPHHLIDVADPTDVYTAAQFARDAARVIREIHERGHLPVLVGGTGFYYRALTRGLFPGPGADEGLRCEVGTLRPDDLFEAAEVFLTATTAGVWPAASVDDKQVGSGKPGPVTERLRERLTRAETGEDPAFEHWLAHVEA